MEPNPSALTTASFVRRVGIVVGITLLALLLTGLLGAAFEVLLLVLAALLIALPLRAGARWLHEKTHLPEGLALLAVALLVLALLGGMFWLLSAQIGDQIGQLQDQLPQAFRHLQQRVATTRWGRWLAEENLDLSKVLRGNSGWLSRATGVLSSTAGVLANLYVVIFLALFIAVQPRLYRTGIVLLVPKSGRRRAGEVLDALDRTLVKWLLGQLLSMLIVGVCSGVGLGLLGVPLAGALGLFAGLITFIPNLGPVLSMIPALLLALLQGPQQALYVLLLYGGIQAVESNLLTPLVQKRLIAMPAALILVAQLVIGLFSGILGLMLATPIMAMVLVLVKMLYIQDVLNDDSVEV